MSPDLLAAALAYAAAGWPVHPCQPGGKEPLTRWRDAATTDPRIIASWWRRWPDANVAIVTGAPGPDVVDFDTKDGRAGLASLDRLRAAGLLSGAFALIRTQSGGWHLYYAGTDQRNANLGPCGVDFRGAGGYVLAPPSLVGGRPYVLAERREQDGQRVDFAAIRRLLDPPPPLPGARPGGRSNPDALVRWVARQPQGGRNNALFWAACRAMETGAGRDVLVALVDAGVTAGLSEDEAVRTVKSAMRRTGCVA
ncbi:MAG TPA: bifunctional DNA primase/polymerase [Micromonosporaceae bacterium]